MTDGIVITGMGIVSPIGIGEAAFWESLCQGRSAASPVDCLDTSELPRSVGCQIHETIDATPNVGRASQLAIAAAHQAVDSARIDLSTLEDNRSTVIIGTTMGETCFIENRLAAPDEQWLSDDHLKELAVGVPGCISGNVLANLPLSGTASDLYGACAAGNMALSSARRALLSGGVDVAIAGGADGFSRLAFIGFMRARVMSAGICSPFDEKRDGLLVGEGGVVFVLERESLARARGARIRARLLGDGTTCEDYHPTRPDPEGDGLFRASQIALKSAGIGADDVDYVCAHGTGTPQNDAIEVKMLQRCFPNGVAFSSIKALAGHCMGAASAMETACCILSIEHQTLVPTWHLENLIQTCTLDAVRGGVRRARMKYALNNSAGFGGYNSSLVLAAA